MKSETIESIKELISTNPDEPIIIFERHIAKDLIDGYNCILKPDEPPRKWDVMLDLKTWGVRPGCAIRSIGAVCFDPNSDDIGGQFYCNVSLAGQVSLMMESDTIKWWQGQSQEAQDALAIGAKSLGVAAQSFREWFHMVNGGNVWAHGAAFDIPILDVACRAVNVPVPWHYQAVRDTRTLYALAEFDVKGPSKGTKHHALHDARNQVLSVQAAMRKLHSPWGIARRL